MVKKYLNYRNTDLVKSIILTFFILFIYRLGCGLTIPGIERSIIDAFNGNVGSSNPISSYFGIINMLGGGTIEKFSFFSLGLSPYITASIVIEILSINAIPVLTRWKRVVWQRWRKMESVFSQKL